MEISELKQIFKDKKAEASERMDKANPEIDNALNWLLPEMFAEQVPKVVEEVLKIFLIDLFECSSTEDPDYDCSIEDKKIRISTTIAHSPVPEPDATEPLMFFAEKQVTKENRIERIMKKEEFKSAWTKASWNNICDYGYDVLLGCIVLEDSIQLFAIPVDKIVNLCVEPLRESKLKAYSTVNDVQFEIKSVKFYDIILDEPKDRKFLTENYYIGGIKFNELCWATQTREEILEFLRYMLNRTNIAGRMPNQIRPHLIKTIEKYVEEKDHE